MALELRLNRQEGILHLVETSGRTVVKDYGAYKPEGKELVVGAISGIVHEAQESPLVGMPTVCGREYSPHGRTLKKDRISGDIHEFQHNPWTGWHDAGKYDPQKDFFIEQTTARR